MNISLSFYNVGLRLDYLGFFCYQPHIALYLFYPVSQTIKILHSDDGQIIEYFKHLYAFKPFFKDIFSLPSF